MSSTKAKRELSKYIRTGRNWRLMGLYAAHPAVPTGISERDLAKAWPTTDTEQKRLGLHNANHGKFGADRKYSVPEDEELKHLGTKDGQSPYRQLSAVTNESDWQDGPFDEQAIHADRAISRALAFEDSIENLDVLFRKELFDTVIEGARKAEIARDAVTQFPVDRQRGDHPRGSDTRFAPEVAEGAAIEDRSEDYDTVDWSTDKFGEGAAATDELITQGNVSVIERNVEFIGHTVEMTNNRLWLNTLLDDVDTGNDVDASAEDNRGWAAINAAIEQIELSDEEPDTVVQHPSFTKTLFDTAENNAIIPFANEFGDDEGIRDRVAFPLLGLEGFRSSGGVADPNADTFPSDTTWAYDSADDYGAVAYDRDRLGMYLFRDIEMKEYEDPIRDLQAVNARMEVDYQWHQNDAGSRIAYSTT
jgi:hypothetical protein